MSASTGTIQQPLSGKGSLFGLAAMVAAALLAAAVAWGALGLTKPHAITTRVPTPVGTDRGSRFEVTAPQGAPDVVHYPRLRIS